MRVVSCLFCHATRASWGGGDATGHGWQELGRGDGNMVTSYMEDTAVDGGGQATLGSGDRRVAQRRIAERTQTAVC